MVNGNTIPIDWNKVDRLIEAGNDGVRVASHFGMHPDTLYIRCKNDKGMTYTAYSAEKRAKGDSLLAAKQYEVAMKGNVTMLIWLGKQRLKQQETVSHEHGIIFKEIDPTDRYTPQVSMPSVSGSGLESPERGN